MEQPIDYLQEAKRNRYRSPQTAQADALISIAEQLRAMNLRAALDASAEPDERGMIFDDIMHTLYPNRPTGNEEPPRGDPETDIRFRFPLD